MLNILKYVLLCICFYSQLYSGNQNNNGLVTPTQIKQFADYLYKQSEYERAIHEYEKYLYHTDYQYVDSVYYNLGKCYNNIKKFSSAIDYYNKILLQSNNKFILNKTRIELYHTYYLTNSWIDMASLKPTNDNEFIYYYYGNTFLKSSSIDQDFFSIINDPKLYSQIIDLEKERQSIKYKSPVFAGILSAFIPGLGKVYNERPGDALFAFITTTGTGLLSVQASKENRNILGTISGFVTVTFYMGSIYGSYWGANWYNNDRKVEWNKKLLSLLK